MRKEAVEIGGMRERGGGKTGFREKRMGEEGEEGCRENCRDRTNVEKRRWEERLQRKE